MEEPIDGEISNETIDALLKKIDDWIKGVNIIEPAFDDIEIYQILNMSHEQMKNCANNELARYAYQIYGYVDYLQRVYNKEKSVMEFAEESIWSIISVSYDNYGSDYKKWQVKYYAAVRENPLATKLSKLKNNCKTRVTNLEHRIEHVKKRADILLELSRRF
jgi:hypothetical protein